MLTFCEKKKNSSLNLIKERKFKPVTGVDQTFVHFEQVGHMMHKDSEDARNYLVEKKNFEDKSESFYSKSLIDKYVDEDGNTRFRVLRNKFNFIDRASQTNNNVKRDVEIMTEPPVQLHFSDQVSLYTIYLAYLENESELEKNKVIRIIYVLTSIY